MKQTFPFLFAITLVAFSPLNAFAQSIAFYTDANAPSSPKAGQLLAAGTFDPAKATATFVSLIVTPVNGAGKGAFTFQDANTNKTFSFTLTNLTSGQTYYVQAMLTVTMNGQTDRYFSKFVQVKIK